MSGLLTDSPPETLAVEEHSKTAKWLRLGAGLALGLIFLVLVGNSVDIASVGRMMMRAAWLPLLLALIAYAVDFVLRAARFWLLLMMGRRDRAPFWPTVSPFIASFGISDILPFRLGDAFRVYWFHKNGRLPVGQVLGAMIVERVLDLVSIVLLASLVLFALGDAVPATISVQFQTILTLTWAACLLVLLSPVVLEGVAGWIDGHFSHRLFGHATATARAIAGSIRALGTMRRMVSMILLSVFLWLLESLVMLGAWLSLSGSLGEWMKPFLAFTISTLGTLVPALPGHFGSYEYFGLLSFDMVQVDPTMATAVILLAHLILWIPTALFGIVWLLTARRDRPAWFRTVP